jgi:hypothetical protein
MRTVILAGLGAVFSCSALAYDRIPADDGFSGSVLIGAGAYSMETNTLASIVGADVGDERLDSLTDSPDAEDYGKPVLDLDLSYTFAGSRTQVFGGTEMEDFLTQDSTLGLGVRQGLGGLGNLRVSLLATMPSEVWEDPYLVGADRQETDREGTGLRLGWEHIFESDLDLTYSSRSIELDDELSGTALGLSPGQRGLLDREGDLNKASLSYRWEPSTDHLIVPSLSAIDYDLDGDAMAMDGYQLELAYIYRGMDRWEFMLNLVGGTLESDDTNPIYNEEQDLDRMGVSFVATYKHPFDLRDWSLRASLAYGEEDSNIDFYDTSIQGVALGMLYSF